MCLINTPYAKITYNIEIYVKSKYNIDRHWLAKIGTPPQHKSRNVPQEGYWYNIQCIRIKSTNVGWLIQTH